MISRLVALGLLMGSLTAVAGEPDGQVVALPHPVSATLTEPTASGPDSAWYNRGVEAVKDWLSDDFPTIYCDTAYRCHDYNIVFRAILARDWRCRVRTTVSGDSAVALGRQMIRFTPIEPTAKND